MRASLRAKDGGIKESALSALPRPSAPFPSASWRTPPVGRPPSPLSLPARAPHAHMQETNVSARIAPVALRDVFASGAREETSRRGSESRGPAGAVRCKGWLPLTVFDIAFCQGHRPPANIATLSRAVLFRHGVGVISLTRVFPADPVFLSRSPSHPRVKAPARREGGSSAPIFGRGAYAGREGGSGCVAGDGFVEDRRLET